MLGEKLKALRREHGWTQKTLAMALQVDRSTVAYWESGRTEPSVDAIRQLTRLFQVSADYLLDLPHRDVSKPDFDR